MDKLKCPIQNGMECNGKECAWFIQENGSPLCSIKEIAIGFIRLRRQISG
jgi:hypothetical protein